MGRAQKGNSSIAIDETGTHSQNLEAFWIFNGYSYVFTHHFRCFQSLALANIWCAVRWSRQESNSRSQPSKRFVGEAAFVTAIDHEPWSHWNMRWSAFFNWPLTTWIFINILVTSCGFHEMPTSMNIWEVDYRCRRSIPTSLRRRRQLTQAPLWFLTVCM